MMCLKVFAMTVRKSTINNRCESETGCPEEFEPGDADTCVALAALKKSDRARFYVVGSTDRHL